MKEISAYRTALGWTVICDSKLLPAQVQELFCEKMDLTKLHAPFQFIVQSDPLTIESSFPPADPKIVWSPIAKKRLQNAEV